MEEHVRRGKCCTLLCSGLERGSEGRGKKRDGQKEKKERERERERGERLTEPEPEKQTEREQLVLSSVLCLQPVRTVKLTSS